MNEQLTNAEIETIHGVEVRETSLTAVVTSNGGTKKEDFVVLIDRTYECPRVSIVRLKPDPCKAAARPYPVTFSLSDVGANVFVLTNPIDPMPGW